MRRMSGIGKRKRNLLMMTAISLSLMPMTAYANGAGDTMAAQPVIVGTKLEQAPGAGVEAKAAPEAKISKDEAVAFVKSLFPQLEKAKASRVELGNNHSFPAPYQNIWDIQWELATANGTTGFNSQVDSLTGELLQMHLPFHNEGMDKAYYPPKVSEQEALKLAKGFVFKASKGLTEADLKQAEQPKYSENPLFGPVQYSFLFTPQVEGLPSPSESIWVTVDGNGEVVGYNRNKIAAEYPSSKPAVTLEKASESYLSKLDLTLQYTPDFPRYGKNKNWFLGWAPAVTGELSIDAQTGDFLNRAGDVVKPEQVQFKPVQKTSSLFTPVKGEDKDGQLTEDQAAAAIEKLLPDIKELKRSWSALNPYWNDRDKKVWNINWSSMSPMNPYGGKQTNAVIDASTGQVLVLNANMMAGMPYPNKPETIDKKDVITQQAAEEKAIALLNELYPNASGELRQLSPDPLLLSAGSNDQFTFRFQRFLDGIAVGGDYTSLTLDHTGQLVTYSSMRSSGIEEKAASLKATVSKEQAQAAFFKDLKLELQYKSFGGFYGENRYTEQKLKLAYGLVVNDNKRAGYLLDAATGEWRNWNTMGPNSGGAKNIPSDLTGHWAQKDLETLLLRGVLQPNEQGAIAPDEAIKVGDWISMVAKAIFPLYSENYYGDPSAKPVFEDVQETSPYYTAVQLLMQHQWLNPKAGARLGVEDALTREKLAVLVVSMLKYDKLALQVNEGVELPFPDEAEIKERGAVWLAWQLGLLGEKQERFNPQGTVTKAQAASVLMRIVHLQGKLDQPIVN